ncbi:MULTISPECIES: endonuclease domain-containing protein [unclassified Leucobacter]|uniref:endonuclease domain-containing protein n=1 Tax=unclassified Leucobacter TaxID=2621730 RepID=UPI00165E3E75|nr:MULTISPECIES: DUF559 domain-containing protein [unclassified Leucobacter]MBC9936411.1 DUF559 domain-containing protein [Leucobacter sp. cx-87]
MMNAARLFAPRIREGEAVSHTSALLMYGCPIRVGSELHVTAQPHQGQNRSRGVRGHRHLTQTSVTQLQGIPVVFAKTALTHSARMLSLRELVVAIDHLVRPPGYARSQPAPVTIEDLLHSAEKYHGHGSKTFRLALGLARLGAESRMESLTRLVLHAFGLEGYFELQVDLEDADGWFGRFDLVDHQRSVIVEFDGDQHRTDKTQYEKDLLRLDRARAAGYTVIRLRSGDVLDRPLETATRVASALGVDLRPHVLKNALLAHGGSPFV